MTDDGDVRERLARIEGKLDAIALQHAGSERTSGDHEQRLRALEKWKYALPIGALGAIVAGASTLITALKGGA